MTFVDILNTIKEYWFFITLFLSVITTIFYFIFFDVNPFEKQYEIKIRKEYAKLNNAIGLELLRLGYHAKAKEQFDKVFGYRPHDRKALKGYFLSELFLELQSISRDPSIISAMLKRIKETGFAYDDEYSFIFIKFLTDLGTPIAKTETYLDGYRNAITKAETYDYFYMDAYNYLGWGIYSTSKNLEEMEEIFSRMCKEEPHDYRGFHGLGYTYYMKAIREKDINKSKDHIKFAEQQCRRAITLIHNRAYIAMDLGEIVRSSWPEGSIFFHKLASEFLTAPEVKELPENATVFSYSLLHSEGEEVYAKSSNQKLAFVKFELALDYLSLAYQNKYSNKNFKDELENYERYLEEAKKLDENQQIISIYYDQLTTLINFLPDIVDLQ